MAAGLVLVLLHRGVALLSALSRRFDDFVNGREVELVSDGKLDRAAMRKALVSRSNLEEAMRQKLGSTDLSRVERVLLERDGKITVIGRH